MDRLDKILVSQSVGSRKDVQKLIRQKKVTVNGEVVTKPDFKVNEDTDLIKVCGQVLEFKKFVYIMMNKPQGVVSASADNKDKTVIDILPAEMHRKGLFPAGRLDKDTEGLLIITDDGDFAHKMLSPKKKIYKKYYAQLDGKVTQNTVEAFEQGVVFKDGTKCLPARLRICTDTTAEVEICEGKYHQVKKMFLACNLTVKYLKRVAIGSLDLDEKLSLGECKYITKQEKNAIFVNK